MWSLRDVSEGIAKLRKFLEAHIGISLTNKRLDLGIYGI